MRQFLDMGGYAAFVWPAYAISLGSLAAIVASTLAAYARAKAKLVAVLEANA